MIFFIGWHQPVNGPSGCANFPHAMISVNRLVGRQSPFPVQSWILDSGAFTRLFCGKGHLRITDYASEIIRWSSNGNMMAAVAQDWMCESVILAKTGKTIQEHQKLSYYNYLALRKIVPDSIYVMPVLQGFAPDEYVQHIRMYGDRLQPEMWVGVGSVCKRNGNPSQIEAVLMAIKTVRPDLRLHGFGLKRTALKSSIAWDLLYSADSLAPSYHARKNPQKGKSSNDPSAALEYARAIHQPSQMSVFSCLTQ